MVQLSDLSPWVGSRRGSTYSAAYDAYCPHTIPSSPSSSTLSSFKASSLFYYSSDVRHQKSGYIKTSSAISWATSRGAHEARCQGDKNSRRPKMQYIITRSLGAPLGRGPALGQNIPLPNVRYVVDFLF